MRRAAKVDTNHAAIVETLRKAGCSVQSLAAVGQGCPDLLVGRLGRQYLLEVKDGARIPSQRRLTPAQEEWHQRWRGSVSTVHSPREALQAVGFSVTAFAGGPVWDEDDDEETPTVIERPPRKRP